MTWLRIQNAGQPFSVEHGVIVIELQEATYGSIPPHSSPLDTVLGAKSIPNRETGIERYAPSESST